MKRRLCIGLINPTEALVSILDSIGVWYETAGFDQSLSDRYVLLIIEKSTELNSEQIHAVLNFRAEGNSVLEICTSPKIYTKVVSLTRSTSIFNTGSGTEFDRISHIDLYSEWASSKNSRLLSGLVDFEDDSSTGFIGLDLNRIFENNRYVRKRFLSISKPHPDEIVSETDRGTITDLIELTIQRLLHKKKLPFIKKWISPEKNSVFCFRIDTDYGTKESLSEIYGLLKKHSIKASWFLHVKAHEEWLGYFKNFKGQEIALHGYEHGAGAQHAKIKKNINDGLGKLREHNITPEGYCAPYGIWSEALGEVLKEFNFNYSSEFTKAYDALPFFTTKHLQIPIHPVCTGSLSRKRYSSDQMGTYFQQVYQNKKNLFKPIIFYHHPLQPGLEVFGSILGKVNNDKLTNLTFIEYARFWEKRHESQFTAFLEDNSVMLQSTNKDLFLHVSSRPGTFNLVPATTRMLPKSIPHVFKYQTPSLPSINEMKELYSKKWNLLKTSFMDWRNRSNL